MKMLHILRQRMAQGGIPKQNQPRETLLLDGTDPALGVCVQVRAPRWQDDASHAGLVDVALKGRAEFPVSIVDQVRAWIQKSLVAMVTFRATCLIQC